MEARDISATWLCVLLVVGACVRSETDRCPSGDKLCPGGTQCVIAEGVELCVPGRAITECEGLIPDSECPSGRCYATEPGPACLAPNCGNGFVEFPVERCDDGNNLSDDGCAAGCRSDETCPNGVIDPGRGEQCDDGNVRSHDGCASGCALERPHWFMPRFGATPRARHAMVFDARRGRTVVFGGENVGLGIGITSTSEWNGRDWLHMRSGLEPSIRTDHAMAYDDVRGVAVMFGGDGRADTWEWNGSGWTFREVDGPRARGGAALAFDRARRRIVLFGGRAGSPATASAETWEWDGTSWKSIGTAHSPPATPSPGMTYDPIIGRTVLVADASTWAFDGTDWALIAPSRPPTLSTIGVAFDTTLGKVSLVGRSTSDSMIHVWVLDGSNWIDRGGSTIAVDGFAAVFDSRRGRLVLFGGGDTVSTKGDVFEWNGTTWESPPLSALTLPAVGRRGAAVANELGRGRVLLFGGRGTTVAVDETWTFDGINWNRLLTPAPPPRYGHAMAYDAARGQVVLFGGTGSSGAALDETWIWDGSAWTERTPPASPSGRTGHAMAYDAQRRRVVMFGGAAADAPQEPPLDDTWEWDGSTWIPIPGSRPSARHGASLAFDPIAGYLVLFGGERSDGAETTTWTFNGAWTQQPALASPISRTAATLTWDAGRGRLILFGGERQVQGVMGMPITVHLNDAWEWIGVNGSDSTAGLTWREVPVDAKPTERSQHVAFTSPDGVGTSVFLGTPYLGSDGLLVLAWDGANPQETCVTRFDGDGDGRAGCEDPDCWTRCTPLCPPAASCSGSSFCGDATCDRFEDPQICATDCGTPPASCGDAVCEPNEPCVGDCTEP